MNIDKPSTNFLQLPGMKRPVELPAGATRSSPFGFLPNRVRNHLIAMIGEFLGTFLFLFFAFAATQVANQAATGNTTDESSGLSQVPNASTLLYISLGFGFSLAVNAWVFFRISGGLFNPAVTLGMALIGAVNWTRAGLVFISQILGSMCSSAVVSAMFPGPLNVSTTLGPGTSIARGLFIEMFLTFELVFTIFMLAAEKHKGTFLAPVGIGLSLFIAELAGVYFTGGSLNPARSFGPCVATRNFPGYHWLYWLGPALGSLCAVGFYRLVKLLEYETANPGQDFNEREAEVFEFDEDKASTRADVARPNVQIGNPDFVADAMGTVRSNSSLTPGDSARRASSGRGIGGAATTKPAAEDGYDGTDSEKRVSGHRRSGSKGSSNLYDQTFRAAPDAENGVTNGPGMAGRSEFRG